MKWLIDWHWACNKHFLRGLHHHYLRWGWSQEGNQQNNQLIYHWLIDWLIDLEPVESTFWRLHYLPAQVGPINLCLIDWIIDWLIDWRIDWLRDWLVDWFLEGLIDWLRPTLEVTMSATKRRWKAEARAGIPMAESAFSTQTGNRWLTL